MPVLLVLAATIRLYGVDFGLPALLDPDELMFELGAVQMLKSGSLNPGWFGHPATTTMYVLAVINASVFGVGWAAGLYQSPADFMAAIYQNPSLLILPGRISIVGFSILAIWQLKKLADPMMQGNAWIGSIFAAALLAFSPLYVQHSQIIRSDIMGTAFMLLTLGAAVRIADQGKLSDYLWASIWLALALASKWPFGITALAVFGAAYHQVRENRSRTVSQLKCLLIFTIATPILVLVISPYLLLDFSTAFSNITGEARVQHLGATSEGFVRNALWYIREPLFSALSPAGLVISVIGLVIIALRPKQRRIFIPVLAANLILMWQADLRWERWAIPTLPFFALGGGIIVDYVFHSARKQKTRLIAITSGLALLTIPVILAYNTMMETRARSNDTRLQATAWLDNHANEEAMIMIEHFAFDLIHRSDNILFPMGAAGCVNSGEMLKGYIDYSLVEEARKGRGKFDFGTVSLDKQAGCEADFYVLTENDRYVAEERGFEQEQALYADLILKNRLIATFEPRDQYASGPKVYILAQK